MSEKLMALFEFMDKLAPAACSLMAILGLAYIAYMVFCDWMIKREAAYKDRIADLEWQLDRKEEQLQKSLQQNCQMAYDMNDAQAQIQEANARADGNSKRADKMAQEAEKYRRMADQAA